MSDPHDILPVDPKDVRPGQILVGVLWRAPYARHASVVLVDQQTLRRQRGHALPIVTTWLAALLLALAIGAAHYLDGAPLADHSADYAAAADLEAAQQQAAREQRYQSAVQRLCGPNAAWMELQDGSAIQCTDKHGRRTHRVSLAAATAATTAVATAQQARP